MIVNNRLSQMARLRFSELSAPRQALIRQCQRLGFGSIWGLEVRDGEPMFGPKTEVLFDLKLDSDETPRPELNLSDFVVCTEIRRLFSRLDTFANGTVEIEVRAGVPRRLLFKATEPMDEQFAKQLRNNLNTLPKARSRPEER
jgi:hypothetical protein